MFYSGEKLIEYLKKEDKFDLIFLDIELGNTRGTEVASHKRNKFDDYMSKIVFIHQKIVMKRSCFRFNH